MTDDMMNLSRLVKKTPDSNLLREMFGFAAKRLMEVGAATGAGDGDETEVRFLGLVIAGGYTPPVLGLLRLLYVAPVRLPCSTAFLRHCRVIDGRLPAHRTY